MGEWLGMCDWSLGHDARSGVGLEALLARLNKSR